MPLASQAETYRIVTNPDYSRAELIKVYVNGRYIGNRAPYENELYSIDLAQGKYHIEVVRLLNDKEEYFGATTLDTNQYDNTSIFFNLKKRSVRSIQKAEREPIVTRVPAASFSPAQPTVAITARAPLEKVIKPLQQSPQVEAKLAEQQTESKHNELIKQQIVTQQEISQAVEQKKRLELEKRVQTMERQTEKKIAATEKALQAAQEKAELQLAATEKALQAAQAAAEQQIHAAQAAQKEAEAQLLAARKLSEAAEKISQKSLAKITETATVQTVDKASHSDKDSDNSDKPSAPTKKQTETEALKAITSTQLAAVSSSSLLRDEYASIKHLVDDDSALELETILLYQATAPRFPKKRKKSALKVGHYATLAEQERLLSLQSDIKAIVKTFQHEEQPHSKRVLKALLEEAQVPSARIVSTSSQDKTKDSQEQVHSAESKTLNLSIWPQMVAIPKGSFILGCQGSKHCSPEEKPAHKVTIKAFRLAKTEVTFRQWEVCVKAKVCSAVKDDRGWGRGNRPVINVSWDDVQKYLAWLSAKKNKTYRLPTEQEWEYAARAGTETLFSSGNCLTSKQANFNAQLKDRLSLECASGHHEYHGKTLEVANFQANKLGLYDMHGNVWEWTKSCWSKSYDIDKEVKSRDLEKTKENCENRVLRGGAWHSPANNLRASYRFRYSQDTRSFDVGFRVASDI